MNLKHSENSRGSKKLSQTTNRSVYNRYLYDAPPYWDEGIMLYPKYRPGFKNSNKQLMSYKVRMYKTWKYNRKTQWK